MQERLEFEGRKHRRLVSKIKVREIFAPKVKADRLSEVLRQFVERLALGHNWKIEALCNILFSALENAHLNDLLHGQLSCAVRRSASCARRRCSWRKRIQASAVPITTTGRIIHPAGHWRVACRRSMPRQPPIHRPHNNWHVEDGKNGNRGDGTCWCGTRTDAPLFGLAGHDHAVDHHGELSLIAARTDPPAHDERAPWAGASEAVVDEGVIGPADGPVERSEASNGRNSDART